MMRDIYDCIGIGFGPANIALAVMMKEAHFRGNVLFLERSLEPNWQPGMLLEGSDIQHNPLRDFATPRNPRSRYGFLSYLESVGRLFDFLNLDQPFPPRTEYAGYVRWVAEQFAEVVSYGEEIVSIQVDRSLGADLYQIRSADGRTRLARTIAFAPGRSPLVPPVFAEVNDKRIFHASQYLFGLNAIGLEAAPRSLAIVGASQSAIEIALDLLGRYPDVQLHLIWRGQGVKLKDTSPFTEHIYFPDFVDYFHAAPEGVQRSLSVDLWRSTGRLHRGDRSGRGRSFALPAGMAAEDQRARQGGRSPPDRGRYSGRMRAHRNILQLRGVRRRAGHRNPVQIAQWIWDAARGRPSQTRTR
ncbi:SidA/IucD/PvdA family monooxygenase [Bradyrhizobium sp. UFLA05-112]